ELDAPWQAHLLDARAGGGEGLGGAAHRRLDFRMPDPLAEIEAEGQAEAAESGVEGLGEILRHGQGLDVALVRALRYLQEEAGVADAAGERAEMRQLVELAGQDGEGDAAEARLQPDHAAEAGR